MRAALGIGALGAGLLLVWAGITGGSVSAELRGAFTGAGAGQPDPGGASSPVAEPEPPPAPSSNGGGGGSW